MPDLREAIYKDFEVLYQKEFTTDWKEQRLLRKLETNIMGLNNLESLIERHTQAAVAEAELEGELNGLWAAQSQYDDFRAEFPFWAEDRINEIKNRLQSLRPSQASSESTPSETEGQEQKEEHVV